MEATSTARGRLICWGLVLTCWFGSAEAWAQMGQPCVNTGEPCFLGIDPDIYQMPLFGVTVDSGGESICATVNWSTLPPEAFDLDFMRDFWTHLDPAQQAELEISSHVFVTTHWGTPATPPADLRGVATPADFPNEVVTGYHFGLASEEVDTFFAYESARFARRWERAPLTSARPGTPGSST